MKKVFILFFVLLIFPVLAKAEAVINEISWMGTLESANNEWIELYNNSSSAVDLTGWVLEAIDGAPKINLSGSISANGFFLLERTNDATLPDVAADLIYTGALSNSGEILILKNAAGAEIDKVDGSSDWKNIGGDNITKQTAQRTVAGGWITATSTPKTANATGLSQSQATNQESQPSQPAQTQVSGFSPSPSLVSVSVQAQTIPQIKAYAGEDRRVVTGADVKFSGLALGQKGEPIDNAGFLWTFGEGSFKEGRVVSHIYQFPGDYIAVLDISSGQYSASDRALVKVNKAELLISEIKTGDAGWIEIKNKSKEELDISGLQIKQQSQFFSFPQSTFIKAGAIIVVSESSSKIKLAESGEVGFFYANDFPIDKFSYQGILKEGESFNRTGEGEKIYIAKETPGEENIPFQITLANQPIQTAKKIPPPAPSAPAPELKGASSSPAGSQEIKSEEQTASVIKSGGEKTSSWLFWFLISSGIGGAGAGGFLFYRRKSRDEFKVE